MEATRMEELWMLVRQIPPGRVTSYGNLGAALRNPTTGRIVGRWMAQCPEDVPWWRVVSKNGSLPVSKRHPMLGITQRDLLEREGVGFISEGVDMRSHEFADWEN